MKLTKAQKKALVLLHLGGIEALGGRTARRTIDRLVELGLLDRRGLTATGRPIAAQLADEEHRRVVGAVEHILGRRPE